MTDTKQNVLSTPLQLGNQAMQEKKYAEAINWYQLASEQNGKLKHIAEFNINKARNNIKNKTEITKIQNSEAPTLPNKNKAKISRVAVIFHAYHEQIIEEIIQNIAKIKINFDLYITTPLQKDADSIKGILRAYPKSEILHSINRGRDILPFLQAFNKIEDYQLCLKIHTKQGLTNYGDLWRDVSLQCLLKNSEYIENIIEKFAEDEKIAIAGPKDFYLSGRDVMHGNRQNIIEISQLLGLDYSEKKEWAFFAGTMFWFRPNIFKQHIEKLKSLDFQKETGVQDGGIEHAIERLFGLIPSYQGMNALLLDGYDSNSSITNVTLPSNAGSEDPTKHLSTISQKRLKSLHIGGDINKQPPGSQSKMQVRGWLAKKNDKRARSYIVRIDNQEFEGTADIFRKDLKDAHINDGYHAFEINVPLKFADGREHNISLYDKEYALPIASNKYKWNGVKRLYTNFVEYLAWSYTGQFVSTPFVEEDKRAFSIMELVANDLSSEGENLKNPPLVSVIMPTYNREAHISQAIQSVINQKYKNWELLIIDDGSTDNTKEVVKRFNNKKIKYTCLPVNSGVSAARNHALQKAQGEYIAYLDSDNDWDNRYLSSMIGAAKCKLRNSSALYCGQIIFTGKTKEISGVRFGLFNKSLLLNNNFIDLNCFIHKRIINGKTPQFDESLKRFVDWDLIARISMNCNIASIPVLLSNYYLEATNNSITGNKSLLPHLKDVREKMEKIKILREGVHDSAINLHNGISIIIPSYQAKDDLERCLASIKPFLEKKSKHSIELIIVDNNSDSDVIDAINNFSKSTKGSVKLIQLEKNYGFTYAVNIGIKNAIMGNDVLLLNNDAILTPNSLKELQIPLYEDLGFGISVPAQVLPGGTPTICTHVPYALPEYDMDVNISIHHRNLTTPPLFYEGDYFSIDFAPFFCVLIKASTLRLAPQLDELNGRHYRSDRTYCEYIRMSYGLKIAYCPNSIVYHGLQKSTTDLKNRATKNDEYSLIFTHNTWSTNELEQMGKSLPHWNSIF